MKKSHSLPFPSHPHPYAPLIFQCPVSTCVIVCTCSSECACLDVPHGIRLTDDGFPQQKTVIALASGRSSYPNSSPAPKPTT